MDRNNIVLRLSFLFGAILLIQSNLEGQLLPDRYHSEIFTSVLEEPDVVFSTGVPRPDPNNGLLEFFAGRIPINAREYETTDIDLEMDIFEPIGDTIQKRPLIIIAFGGGFVQYDRKDFHIRLLAQELAKRGFVTASIDYRLGMNVFDAELSKRAVYRGLQDGRSAVRFFKNDAASTNTYKIDTNNIFIGGHSSGGFIGLHNAYLDKESERPFSTFTGTQNGNPYIDLGCLDCAGDNQSYNGKAKAVFSLAGALGDTLYMESPGDPPSILFHSTDDGTVQYDNGNPFGLGTLPTVYGSLPISRYAEQLGIQNQFFSYTDRTHDVHIATLMTLHSDIVPGIGDFFYNQCLKPDDVFIEGQFTLCDANLIQSYKAPSINALYYDWEVTGGSVLETAILSDSIKIQWDMNAPQQELKVTPYSINGARGDLSSTTITIETNPQNTWAGGSGNWSDTGNWTKGRTPLSCDDVVIPIQVSPQIITVDFGPEIHIKSLTTGDNIQLIIQNGFEMNIGMQ